MPKRRRVGRSRDGGGYLLNSHVTGRGGTVFDVNGVGIIPYMDGYKIVPLEIDSLEKVELLDKAFEVAQADINITTNNCWFCRLKAKFKRK